MRLFGSGAVPLFLPGLGLSAIIAVVVSSPIGRYLGARTVLACALVVSVGAIVSLTLTPLRSAFQLGAIGSGTCDFSRVWLATPADYLRFDDTSLNVAMFAPLGLTLGLLPRSRRKAVLVVAAVVFPFMIEMTQLVVVALDRACESADVVDNLLGLAIGLTFGTGTGQLARPWLAKESGGADGAP